MRRKRSTSPAARAQWSTFRSKTTSVTAPAPDVFVSTYFQRPVPAMPRVPAHLTVTPSRVASPQPSGQEFCVKGSLESPPWNIVGDSIRNGRM
eukprot:CAMPEP_0115691988 /NCGR_PEP_ID=MMETSP0272-20121206/62955_1 /TAXON_ID=71861 /ORGANISM="Scrippsiella trochoidea, Strain CCMP3099" /LENGTH=92 /DNA_ID=CAMNT_0003132015 /DNA_START=41 /DNA_END=319 /DNA_ORIENTATION=+